MALKLGNFQSPKKASNPSIQIPVEVPATSMNYHIDSEQFGIREHFFASEKVTNTKFDCII